jgi:hypothetical protein
MNDFVSVLDLIKDASYGEQRKIKDEIADMEYSLRRAMDQGLSPDDMKKAQAAREAAQAASEILNKLF